MAIKYDTDGATILDSNGKRVTVYDQPRYSELDAIMDLQLAAEKENEHALDLYTRALAQAQTSIDAGRPADAPQKPMKLVVSDGGVSSYVPFVPVLPDLVYPVVNAGTGSIVTPTVDKMSIMQAQVNAIYKKLFPAA